MSDTFLVIRNRMGMGRREGMLRIKCIRTKTILVLSAHKARAQRNYNFKKPSIIMIKERGLPIENNTATFENTTTTKAT